MARRKRSLKYNVGSVSSGTMRPEDLLPVLIDTLEVQSPLHQADRRLLREIKQAMRAPDYFESDTVSEDVDALFDALNNYAPEGFYFGAHPGDGADYGFWLSESFAEDFDGLQVSDLSEVPTGYNGQVLLVNDHGNMSLYSYSRGRGRELWAVV